MAAVETPVGAALPGWQPRPKPGRATLAGATVRLESIDPARHGAGLWEVSHGAGGDPAIWTYLGVGPFPDEAAFRAWLERCAASEDPLFYAIVDRATGAAAGMCSYLRIDPSNGAIEIGHIWFSPALQRTRQATEAIFLLARRAFDELGYRRFEWKCDALNAPSRRAAERFGFSYEGTFRQHMVIKGRNRDTAWYAMLDGAWPAVRAGFEAWLADDNFDADGRQRSRLEERIGAARR